MEFRAVKLDLKQSQHVEGGEEIDFERRRWTLLSSESKKQEAGRSIKHM